MRSPSSCRKIIIQASPCQRGARSPSQTIPHSTPFSSMDQLRVPLATAAAAGAGAGAGLGGGSLSPSLSRASSFTHVQHAESNDISTVMDQHKVELEHNDDESPAPVQPQQRARPPSVRSLNTSIPHAEPAKTRLCGEERRLALMYRKCGSRRSVAPLLFFLAASLGKL